MDHYTVIQIDGQLKWTDVPKPKLDKTKLWGNDEQDSQVYAQLNYVLDLWHSTLRPLRDEQGFKSYLWDNYEKESGKRHTKDDFNKALSNGIQVPSERCRVEIFVEWHGGDKEDVDVKYLVLLPLETESKVLTAKEKIELLEYQLSRVVTYLNGSSEKLVEYYMEFVDAKDAEWKPSSDSNVDERQEDMKLPKDFYKFFNWANEKFQTDGKGSFKVVRDGCITFYSTEELYKDWKRGLIF